LANNIYFVKGTPITFKDSGGTAVITLSNLGFGAGRVSAQYDKGADPLPAYYLWQGIFQYATAPQVAEVVEVYAFPSDGTFVDGTVGTADAALTTEKRRNGLWIGNVVVDMTSTNTDTVKSNKIELPWRYFSIGVWNASSADNLRNSANTSQIILTPYYAQLQ
jgi:hypothetical protein